MSRQALVRVEGKTYSVPSHWKMLEATAHVGVEDIEVHCYGERLTLEKSRKGKRVVRYRHYLPELAKKPQAVRQVAPELRAELGQPYGELWQVLTVTHGERDAARVLSKILGAVVGQGEEPVRQALDRVLTRLEEASHAEGRRVLPLAEVPEALRGCTVEAARATDYDALLVGAGR